MTKKNKATQQSGDEQVISGIKTHFANVALIAFAAGSYAPLDLEKLYQARIDAAANTAQKEGEYHAAVQAEKAAAAALAPVAKAFKAYVLGIYGNQPTVLDDFGYAPKKKPVVPAAVKAAAAKKAAATRARKKAAAAAAAPAPEPATPAAPKS